MDESKRENVLIALGFAILFVQLLLTLLNSMGIIEKDHSSGFPVERCYLVGAAFTAVAIALFRLGSKSNFIILFVLFGAKYFMSPQLDSMWFMIVTLLTVAVMVICNLDMFTDKTRTVVILSIPMLFLIADVAYLVSNGMVEVFNIAHAVLVVASLVMIWAFLFGKLNAQGEKA